MKHSDWHIQPYTPERKVAWDEFVTHSKNATFLFLRNYMEYHANRFTEASLMIYKGNTHMALLPGNLEGETFHSHQGLTYGGLLMPSSITYLEVEEALAVALIYLRNQLKVRCVCYRAIPHIYHLRPAEEDLYALFRLGASLRGRSLSSVLTPSQPLPFRQLRRRQQHRAEQMELQVVHDNDFSAFWPILEENLMRRHNVHPVHSLAEIELLHNRFPHNIKLHRVVSKGCTVGGCVVYETTQVAHVQYIAATEEGKRAGALDLLFAELIHHVYHHKPYFDFGISSLYDGMFLNQGLLFQKEGFGARAVLYDTYELIL